MDTTGQLASFTEDIIYQWRKKWSAENLEILIEGCAKDDIWLSYVRKYLPKDSPILEAGCGPGQWVIYFGRLGYKMTGIEIVPDCVRSTKEFFPQADIRTGDIRQMPFPNDFFGGYISMGVLEHLIEGPGAAIAEMRRVLKKGGIAIIHVPAFNYFMRLWYPLRQRLVDPIRANNIIRRILGLPAYQGNVSQLKEKMRLIKSQLRPEFWPVIGLDLTVGPVFIEYKCPQKAMESLFQKAGFDILEAAPIYHPLIFSDIFGGIFFTENKKKAGAPPELNAPGRWLLKVFQAISPNFFSYINIYILRKR